jgi:hypothetical protein
MSAPRPTPAKRLGLDWACGMGVGGFWWSQIRTAEAETYIRFGRSDLIGDGLAYLEVAHDAAGAEQGADL